MNSDGDWEECRFDDVVAEIERRAGDPDLSIAHDQVSKIEDAVEAAQHEIVSALTLALESRPDAYIRKILEQAEIKRTFFRDDFEQAQI